MPSQNHGSSQTNSSPTMPQHNKMGFHVSPGSFMSRQSTCTHQHVRTQAR